MDFISLRSSQKEPDEEKYNETSTLTTNIEQCIFGWSIPALWRESDAYTFIINAGHACGEGNQHGDYLEDDTAAATGVCVDDNQYYVVYPKDGAEKRECKIVGDHGPCQTVCQDNKFSVPPGLETLKNGQFGGLTKEQLVKGSVRTWVDNGKKKKKKQRASGGPGRPNDRIEHDRCRRDDTWVHADSRV